jgi:peroxiredoxin
MKNIWLLAGGLAILSVGCNSATKGDDENLAKGSFTLTGEIKGMDTGTIEILYPLADSSHTDEVTVKNTKFTYETTLNEPVNMILRIKGTRGEELAFFADPGKMSLKGNRDSIFSSTIEGGPSQKIYKAGEEKIKTIMSAGESLYMQYMQAQQTQNPVEMQRIQDAFTKMQGEAVAFAKEYAVANRNSVVAAYYGLLYMNEPGKPENVQMLYDTLTPAVKKSYFGGKLQSIVNAAGKTAVGQMAPEFSQTDTSGNPISLSSLRGKYVLLDFWASWCGPCREENPNIVKAYAAYKDKGLDILGVSLDQQKSDWLKAIQDDKLYWKQVSDLKYWENDVAKLYGIQSIPASYLLDKEGRIIAKNLRGAELEAKLAELMPQ